MFDYKDPCDIIIAYQISLFNNRFVGYRLKKQTIRLLGCMSRGKNIKKVIPDIEDNLFGLQPPVKGEPLMGGLGQVGVGGELLQIALAPGDTGGGDVSDKLLGLLLVGMEHQLDVPPLEAGALHVGQAISCQLLGTVPPGFEGILHRAEGGFVYGLEGLVVDALASVGGLGAGSVDIGADIPPALTVVGL